LKVRAISQCSGFFSVWSTETVISRIPPEIRFTKEETSVVCEDISPVTYTVAPIPNATSYSWSIPPGWSGSSSTNSIILIPSGQNGGTITASAQVCGQSFSQSVNVALQPFADDFNPSVSVSTNLICSSGGTFTLNGIDNLPPGTTYSWVANSSAVNETSGTGSTATLTQRGSSTGFASVTFTITNPCGSTFSVTNNPNVPIWVGQYASSQFSISGSTQVCPGQMIRLTANYATGVQQNVTNHIWTWPSPLTYVSGQGTRFLDLQVPAGTNSINGVATLKVENVCGVTPGSPAVHFMSVATFGCGFSFSMSPNPSTQQVQFRLEDPSETEVAKQSSFLQEEYTLEVSNLNGETKYATKGRARALVIDLSQLRKGIYNVVVGYKGKVKSKKLLMED